MMIAKKTKVGMLIEGNELNSYSAIIVPSGTVADRLRVYGGCKRDRGDLS